MNKMKWNNMKVEVYRNLHKNCWSVRWPNGRVLAHVDEIHLENVDLVVRPAGREKVLREKRKNVHAFAKGEVVSSIQYQVEGCKLTKNNYLVKKGEITPYDATQIVYNPYKYNSFVYADLEEPIFHTEKIYLNKKGDVYVN